MPTRREAMVSFAPLALAACDGGAASGGARAGGQPMKERAYSNPSSWAPPPGYSHAVTTGGGRLVFLSGQVPLDAAGQLVGGADFEAQTRQVFDNLKAVLAAAGASFDDVIKMTYFVVGVDANKVKGIRAIREGYFSSKERRPASSLLGVQALFREDVLIEIEAIAELPPGR
jgi:2-iminobutanoate/2-iminopropanoate deaminase